MGDSVTSDTQHDRAKLRRRLILLAVAVLSIVLAMTIWASLNESIFDVNPVVLSDVWFQATLVDAYSAFLLFYAWIAYRESTWSGRVIWLLLVLSLGSMALASYLLWRLWHWEAEQPVSSLLVGKPVLPSG